MSEIMCVLYTDENGKEMTIDIDRLVEDTNIAGIQNIINRLNEISDRKKVYSFISSLYGNNEIFQIATESELDELKYLLTNCLEYTNWQLEILETRKKLLNSESKKSKKRK